MNYSFKNLIEDLNLGHEIEFIYLDEKYSISQNKNGWHLTKFGDEKYQSFKSVEYLLEKALINNKKLFEIWNQIKVIEIF